MLEDQSNSCLNQLIIEKKLDTHRITKKQYILLLVDLERAQIIKSELQDQFLWGRTVDFARRLETVEVLLTTEFWVFPKPRHLSFWRSFNFHGFERLLKEEGQYPSFICLKSYWLTDVYWDFHYGIELNFYQSKILQNMILYEIILPHSLSYTWMEASSWALHLD